MDSRLASLVDAAKTGNPQAITFLARVQAMGIYAPRNLTLALDNLARAASVDWPEAKRELQILARMSGGNAKKLRASVNPEALRRPPPRRVLLEQPRIRVFENFATPEECDWLIDRCRHRLEPAKVYENSATEAQRHEGRSNSEANQTPGITGAPLPPEWYRDA